MISGEKECLRLLQEIDQGSVTEQRKLLEWFEAFGVIVRVDGAWQLTENGRKFMSQLKSRLGADSVSADCLP